MARYAEGTDVSVERSIAEVRRICIAAGAKRIIPAEDEIANFGVIQFELHGRRIQIRIPYPTVRDPAIAAKRNPAAALEAEKRRRWRVAVIQLKVKLETTADDPEAAAREFLADTLLPSGQTFGAWAEPQIAHSLASGEMPPMLPGLPAVPLLPAPRK